MSDSSHVSSPAASASFSGFALPTMPKPDVYKLLASLILPRPIAWVTTLDETGKLNAAPYSFFNVLSADPPLLAISFSAPPDRDRKDTLAHLRRRGEFVVNLVPEELAEAMNTTAVNAPRGTDETVLAGLETAPGAVVGTPRLLGSPASLECRLFQVIEPGGASTIVLGEVVYVHVRDSVFEDKERLHVDPAQMRLIGRMHGGGGYCRTRDVFTIERKAWPLER